MYLSGSKISNLTNTYDINGECIPLLHRLINYILKNRHINLIVDN